MKKILAAAILFINLTVLAQTVTLSGVVSDELGTLANVQVRTANEKIFTNAKGEYQFTLSKGTHQLVFNYAGKSITKTVVLTADKVLNISFSSTVLEGVILASNRVKATDPFTQKTIHQKALEKQNLGQDIPVLLNGLTNVVTTSDAGAGVGYTGIRVRGSDATRVNVTINGIPLNDSESQGTYWVDLPDFASNTSSIQLQRGVGTSTNGAGAFGASLNLATSTAKEKASTSLALSAGSFNTQKYTLKMSTGNIGNFNFSGRLSKIVSDGYIDRASSDLKSYFFTGNYLSNTKKTRIQAIAFGGHEKTYQSWNGNDGATMANDRTFNSAGAIYDASWNVTGYYDNEVDDYTQNHYQLHIIQTFATDLSAKLALHYTKGYGFYEQYKQDRDFADYGLTPYTVGGVTVDTTDLIRQKWLDNDFYGFTSAVLYKDFKFGLDYNVYSGDHYGKVIWARNAANSEIRHRYYDNNGLKKDFNSYIKYETAFNEKLKGFIDLQARFVAYKTTNFASPTDVDVKHQFFNPKIGFVYGDNTVNYYVSYAKAHKEPNRSDYEWAAVTPQAESLDDIELGYRLNHKKIGFNATFYSMFYKNQLVLTGELDGVGNFIRKNTGKSQRIGLELDARFQLNDKWQVLPNISFSSNKNKDYTIDNAGTLENLGDKTISYSPSIVAGNILSYMPNNHLEIRLLSKYVGKQYLNNENTDEAVLDAYFVNDFNISYQKNINKGIKSIRFNALVNNIFNTQYESNGYMWGTTAYYYPQAGINFLVGTTISF